MEFNWTTVGVLIAVWVVGYLLGLLEAAMKTSNKKERLDEDLTSLADDGSEAVASQVRVLEPEVLAVFERLSGALKLRIDGEIVEYKSDISTEQQKRLINLVVSLRPWIEGTTKEEKTTPLPADAKISTLQESKYLGEEPEVPIEIDPELENVAFANLSMVEQIDRVLQKKLQGHPLEKRGIALRSALDGSLLVRVGLEEYEWIDEIPDQPIQDIIREAIAEWEAKATPR
ncbi:MAG: hypothetical protein HOG15_10670 [Anaerolineae bacterium]|jgi:hypothetical protein|nr:hypothetical protein [Anaerolineae bacterium]